MTTESRETLRILRRLSVRGARLVPVEGAFRLEQPGTPTAQIEAAAVDALSARGLIEPRSDGALILSHTGRALLRRALAGSDGYAAQHQTRTAAIVTDEESGAHAVIVNRDESPLSWLRHRRGKDGRPLLDAASFAAGERLRADYSRGQLMPRVTANWGAAVADGRRDGGGLVELTEAAMAARRRVDEALATVGPEFGGLLVDFCCFLKGLEDIERERTWPARSAKVVLRLGLAALARHYGLAGTARGARAKGVRHWGTDDYRPTID